MKKLISLILLGWTLGAVADTQLAVTSVTAQQRCPGSGLVDITVTLQGSAEDVAKCDCVFVVTNSATQAEIPVHITRNGDDTGSGGV